MLICMLKLKLLSCFVADVDVDDCDYVCVAEDDGDDCVEFDVDAHVHADDAVDSDVVSGVLLRV